jgi:hypothetical protein
MASLRYFFAISLHLDKIASLNQRRELFLRERQDVPRGFSKQLQFVAPDIGPLALGESIYEDRPLSAPEHDDGAIRFRSSPPGSSNPLLDHPSAQISIHEPCIGTTDCI